MRYFKRASALRLASITCIIFSNFSSSYAASSFSQNGSAWVYSLSVGPTWESAGKTQTFALHPYVLNSYVADRTTKPLIDVEFFAGFTHSLRSWVDGQFGFSVATANPARLSGQVWSYASPEFYNFNYSYEIQHVQFSVREKWLTKKAIKETKAYLSGEIGVSLNRAYNYNQYALNSQVVVPPSFRNNTTTSFAYTVGAGLQRALNEHIQVGAGYEFSDWGNSSLDRAIGQTMGTGLSLSHLYTNGLIFHVTYLS